jgi:hypothetical protein
MRRIDIRVSDQDYQAWRQTASGAGSLSEWIRRTLNNHVAGRDAGSMSKRVANDVALIILPEVERMLADLAPANRLEPPEGPNPTTASTGVPRGAREERSEVTDDISATVEKNLTVEVLLRERERLSAQIKELEAALGEAQAAEAERDEALAKVEHWVVQTEKMQAERDHWKESFDVSLERGAEGMIERDRALAAWGGEATEHVRLAGEIARLERALRDIEAVTDDPQILARVREELQTDA